MGFITNFIVFPTVHNIDRQTFVSNHFFGEISLVPTSFASVFLPPSSDSRLDIGIWLVTHFLEGAGLFDGLLPADTEILNLGRFD